MYESIDALEDTEIRFNLHADSGYLHVDVK